MECFKSSHIDYESNLIIGVTEEDKRIIVGEYADIKPNHALMCSGMATDFSASPLGFIGMGYLAGVVGG